jgi:hypothetical protein
MGGAGVVLTPYRGFNFPLAAKYCPRRAVLPTVKFVCRLKGESLCLEGFVVDTNILVGPQSQLFFIAKLLKIAFFILHCNEFLSMLIRGAFALF